MRRVRGRLSYAYRRSLLEVALTRAAPAALMRDVMMRDAR